LDTFSVDFIVAALVTANVELKVAALHSMCSSVWKLR
jgi:hypothetical protein